MIDYSGSQKSEVCPMPTEAYARGPDSTSYESSKGYSLNCLHFSIDLDISDTRYLP